MNFALNNNLKDFYNDLVENIKDFFNPTLDGYENFSFGSGSMINIHIIVFGIFAGVIIASLYSVYTKQILGKFVRKLLKDGITVPEKAATLEELGFKNNFAVRHALRGYTLGRVVNSVEKDRYVEDVNALRENYAENRQKAAAQGKKLPPFKEPSFDKKTTDCRYYIAEKNAFSAERRFSASGSGYPTLLFVLLISVICIVLIYAFLPQILAFIDTAMSNFTVEGNTATHR